MMPPTDGFAKHRKPAPVETLIVARWPLVFDSFTLASGGKMRFNSIPASLTSPLVGTLSIRGSARTIDAWIS